MAEYRGYTEKYSEYSQMVEEALSGSFTVESCPQQNVEEAMGYSLLGGGKRLRGVLVLAACEWCGGNPTEALPLACAVEMIHAYSLIHDDLPCMDNDQLRRGKPTCHIQYGEAVALLAGDGLLTKAFELICDASLNADCRCKAATLLARAAGTRGMIGGQVIDIENEGKSMATPLLDTLHRLKTGALIRAAVALGCVAGAASREITQAADRYAALLGLIFQIVDDVLDVTSTPEELGKSTGSDVQNHKTTYVTLHGVDGSKKIVAELTEQAKQMLAGLPLQSCFLCDLADYMATRTK